MAQPKEGGRSPLASSLQLSDGREASRPRQNHCSSVLVTIRTLVTGDPTESVLAARFFFLITAAIAISILNTCVGTVTSVTQYQPALDVIGVIDLLTGIIFNVELLLRCIAALSEESSTLKAVYGLVRDPLTSVDVLALVPFWVDVFEGDILPVANTTLLAASQPASSNVQASAVQAMRLLRLLRLFTLARHFEGAITLWLALKKACPVLVVPLYFMVTAVLSFAGIFYVVEYLAGANEDFENVFVCAWFVLVTMTSTGYGDIVPMTPLGKAVDAAAMVVGALCMAMPITIVGSAFTDVWETREVARQSAAEARASRRFTAGDSLKKRSIKLRTLPRLRTHPRLEAAGRGSEKSVAESAMDSERVSTPTMPGSVVDTRGSANGRDSSAPRMDVVDAVHERLRALEQTVQTVQLTSRRTEAALQRIEAALLAGSARSGSAGERETVAEEAQAEPERQREGTAADERL